MGYCSIRWCGRNSKSSSYDKDGITFHRFPMNPKMRKKWVQLSRRENWFPTKASMVCSRHFTEDCFRVMKCGRRRLLDTAIPSKHLPILGDAPLEELVDVKPEDKILDSSLTCNQPTVSTSKQSLGKSKFTTPSQSSSDYMLLVKPLSNKKNPKLVDSGNKILCSRILELSGKVKIRNKQVKELVEKVRYYENKVAFLNKVINELRETCPVKAENSAT